MASLRARIERAELYAQQGRPCTDPWHQERDPLATRMVDYRVAVAPLCAGYVAPPGPPPDHCPACGEVREHITVVARDAWPGGSVFGPGRLTVHPEDRG